MTRRPLGRLAAMAALALVMGCDANVATTLLTPTGRRPVEANASISGRLEFGTGTYAQSLVLVAPVLDPSCISSYSKIGISGTLVAAGFNPASAPQLTQLAPCFWVDTLTILAGAPAEWKFTTNDNFDDNPDYGAPGSQVDGLAGTAVNPAPGPDGNLTATVTAAEAGLVVCWLDETDPPNAPYAFQEVGAGSPAVFTSTADGSFSVTGIEPGVYNVLVRTPGTVKDTLIANLVVSGPTSVGTLNLGGPVPVGSVTGVVDYAGPNGFADLASAPYPPTTVQLKQGLTIVASLTTGRTDNAFSFTNVTPGTYEIVVDAPVFQPLTKSSIVVASGPATDAGSFQLVKTNLEVSNFINAAGDFNGWSVNDPLWELGQISLGVWQLTSPSNIAAGDQYMKFVTDQAFDVPADYGGDESAIAVPVTHAITYKVTGSGTAIRLSFPAAGNYTFTLDERRQTFSIAAAPSPARPARRIRP